MGSGSYISGPDGFVEMFPADPESKTEREIVPRGPTSGVQAIVREKVRTIDVLERFVRDNRGIAEALVVAKRMGIDFSPLRRRLLTSPSIAKAYQHLEEYAAVLFRTLESGKGVAVMHPDAQLREAAQEFSKKSVHQDKQKLLQNLRVFGRWLYLRRAQLSEKTDHKE